MAQKRVNSIDDLESVYYMYGDEDLLMEESLKRLRNLFSGEADADFNLEVLDAAEAGAELIIDSAQTLPMMAARRLVIVRDVDKLSKKEQDILVSYLESPNPETTLVLISRFPQPGMTKDASKIKRVESSPLFKKVKADGEVLKFSMGRQGRQQKIGEWVDDEFKKRGKRTLKPARDLLLEMVGRELRDLEDAVERICLFAADDDVISVEVVRRVVIPSGEQGIFELIDAVADRRRDISLYMLNRLIRQGESPQRIFGLLLRQFRLVARIKALAPERDSGAIASDLGIPPFVVGKCIKQSRRFSAYSLRDLFGEFKSAQLELYSSGYLEDKEYRCSVLENLIFKIVG
ncbi:MAG: DNA polymerase III subunit delta [Actinobacteria bacterium]|nr:DNA polymerase III subunit delta [Actinomycetota bacterium]MBU4240114.1 DNA polymerase III subunit delta [Actinomycetota bacterium]MBU4386467.1 DNA polymerase III subunit delta [Actinomycetota bacterium]MBU4489162.1 DNA polymerase III subunit delta [Actinomycetota bacterium]MCG2795971.1 DNA polymerase III subunit delta [Actinomycetes bacterium]